MAISTRDGLTIVERAARNVDWAAVEARRRDEAARAITERIETLRRNVFRNVHSCRDVEALTNEAAAARLMILAANNADSFLLRAVLRVAIDNRWSSVVRAGIKYFGDHPTAAAIQELWTLTTGRPTV